MGDIPAKTSMVSCIITNPQQNGAEIPSDTDFNITVQVENLVAGSFTNADATYYAAPQALSGGKVVGHTHVTVQDLGKNLNPTQPLDPTQFAFFKGINDAGDGQGGLTAVVAGGLPAGNYRVCTMTSASNHQPVLMPVAQRGTPDDCTKFVVSGNGNTKNIAANDGSKGIAAAAAAASAVALGPDVNVAQSGATATATNNAAAAAKGNGNGNGKAGAAAAQASTATNAGSANAGTAQASGAAAAKGQGQAGGKGGAQGGGAQAGGKGQGQGGKGGARRAKREFIA
jgi:hypothetical protein